MKNQNVWGFKRKFRRWLNNGSKLFLSLLLLLGIITYYWTPEDKEEEVNVRRTTRTSIIRHPNDTCQIFPTFDFSDFSWTNSKEYFWNSFLENRFNTGKKKFPLKIIVIPHSHNDPGWGWTYEQYFHDKTSDILNLAVDKLTEYPNMTFQWSEASFMDLWWLSATEQRKTSLKKLIDEKRFQIVTGGWVMTDEAIVPLYSMIDQLIEGQHWFKYHLDVSPQVSWSVDPFGFGSTFPYLLKISGIDSMVILRIHYAWKKWMAENQHGDFHWVQRWDTSQLHKMLCHQAFYTMYLIANSLGPHSEICRKFDFTESQHVLDKDNIEEMALNFVDEAGRTASLYEHNVALPILGADFTFRLPTDWDNTYRNYMKLFEYINSKKEVFNTEVSFGTLVDYFQVIRERTPNLPSLTGDFFPYSDTESPPTNRTAYWSGFYASRPFWKKLHRETEHNVRTAEILFAIANILEWKDQEIKTLSESYPLLVKARQYLALFAHHDASPGVSSAIVMNDYKAKLKVAIQNSLDVQLKAFQRILSHLKLPESIQVAPWHKVSGTVKKYRNWENHIFDLKGNELQQIVLFNSLGWEREQYVKIRVNSPLVGVIDANGNSIESQLNPVIKMVRDQFLISNSTYELTFLAEVPSLALPTIFTIKRLSEMSLQIAVRSKLESNTLEGSDIFGISKWTTGDGMYFLENDVMKLGFSTTSGFLNVIKNSKGSTPVKMSFGGYVSVPHHSGPYLFMASGDKIKVPFNHDSRNPEIVAITGPVSSEVIVGHDPVILSVRILKKSNSDGSAIFIENTFDSKSVAGEFFMKFDTNIKSTCDDENGLPSQVFYTDQSGYTLEKRIKVDAIGIEGNYYPVTTMAAIQDSGQRLSLLIDRSHGAASLSSGSLEVMIERRLLHDDNRGIGQGIFDNRQTTSNYILKLGNINPKDRDTIDCQKIAFSPTLDEHHLSQSLFYPLSIFIITSPEIIDETKVQPFKLFSKEIPKDTRFLNFRTLPRFPGKYETGSVDKKKFSESYSPNTLMIFHKLDYSCDNNEDCLNNGKDYLSKKKLFHEGTKLHFDISQKSIRRTDLSGLNDYSNILPGENEHFRSLDGIYCSANEIASFVLSV